MSYGTKIDKNPWNFETMISTSVVYFVNIKKVSYKDLKYGVAHDL